MKKIVILLLFFFTFGIGFSFGITFSHMRNTRDISAAYWKEETEDAVKWLYTKGGVNLFQEFMKNFKQGLEKEVTYNIIMPEIFLRSFINLVKLNRDLFYEEIDAKDIRIEFAKRLLHTDKVVALKIRRKG